jgi:3-methylfumaryl-CoA hydratase
MSPEAPRNEGESVEMTELITPGPSEALAGLLGVPVPDLADGIPLLWHGVYLLDRAPQSMLGADGHRLSGGVPLPPGPGRRRMFAGGRVRRHGPLREGAEATRTTRVIKTSEKAGRSGPLEIVTVLHEIAQGGMVVLSDEQDIVYRPAPQRPQAGGGAAPPGEVSPGATVPPADGQVVEIDPVLLFRFSALTYNAHRIHYDREFATLVDGYPGLVVHGPLQALFMCEAARRLAEPPVECSFEYRLVSPLCKGEGCIVSARRNGEGIETSVADATGRITARGVLRAG